jgi:hypothetical protein
MKTFSLTLLAISVSHMLVAQVEAQVARALDPPLTHGEQASALGGATKAERVTWMRQQIGSGQSGWRLERMFKGFDAKNYLDPTIPGVTKNVNALNSLSQQQEKGAARTLLFATKVYHDPRFQLDGVDQPVKAAYGRTDKDLKFHHKQTGQRCRIEVKDVKPASQRADLDRIKAQIDKMAAERERTGELQAWVNRQPTIPEIVDYAEKKGVPVYEKTTQAEFPKVMDDFQSRSVVETRVKLAGGGLSAGAGIILLYTSTRGLLDAAKEDSNIPATQLRIGEQGSLLVAGGGLTASGLAEIGIGSRFATAEGALARLGNVAKWGGRAGLAGIIIGEGIGIGIAVYEWEGLTERQRTIVVVQHGVSIGTLVVGFGVGFFAGIETGPGAILLGLGTSGASYVAARVATAAVEDSYDRLDAAQKCELQDYVYSHYGVSQ